MSVTQPPPSSVRVRRARIRSKTSLTTFLWRREQRDASAVLPCRGLLGFARRFQRFSSKTPFCLSSFVAARRPFDIINENLVLKPNFAEPTRFERRRSVSILLRFDAFSIQKSVETFISHRAFAVGAPLFPERRFVRERVAAPSSFWEATRRPTPGETRK